MNSGALKSGGEQPRVPSLPNPGLYTAGTIILHAAWEDDRPLDAKSLEDWRDNIHEFIRSENPMLADCIVGEPFPEVLRPEPPQEPPKPAEGASQGSIEVYRVQMETYAKQVAIYLEISSKCEDKEAALVNEAKKVVANILRCISPQLKEKMKSAIPKLHISHDIHAVMDAAAQYHPETSVVCDDRVVVNAMNDHFKMKQGEKESVFDFFRRFNVSVRRLEIAQAPQLSDKQLAIDFILRLNSNFEEWQTSLIHREQDAQAAGRADDPWPRTVIEAQKAASQRMAPLKKALAESGGQSTAVSSLVRKSIKDRSNQSGTTEQENRSDGKTHAREPEPLKDPSKECTICDGILNDFTDGKKHWRSKCPLTILPYKEKLKLLAKFDDPATKMARTTIASHHPQDDDEDEDSDISGVGSVLTFVNSRGTAYHSTR